MPHVPQPRELGSICLLLVMGVLSLGLLTATPAQADTGTCDKLPTGVLSTICNDGGTTATKVTDAAKTAAEAVAGSAICNKLPSQALQMACNAKVGGAVVNGENPATAGASAATNEVKNVASGLGSLLNPVAGIFKGMAAAVAEGASWFIDRIGKVIFKTTTPNLLASWFIDSYGRMLILGTLVLAPTLIFALIAAYIKHDQGEITRILRCTVLAMVLLPSAPKVVQGILNVSDTLSQGAMWATGNHGDEFVKTLTDALGQVSVFSAGPVAVIGFAAVLMFIGGFTVWLELFIRDAMIVSITFFLAISMIPLVLKDSRKGVTWLLKVLLVAIFAKPLMVSMLGLSELLVTSTGNGSDHLSAILTGGIMMTLVFFAPLALFKVIAPMFGAVAMDALAHRASLSTARGSFAGRTSGGMLRRITSTAKSGLGSTSRGAGGAAAKGLASKGATAASGAATGGALLAAGAVVSAVKQPGKRASGVASRLAATSQSIGGQLGTHNPSRGKPLILRPLPVERTTSHSSRSQPPLSKTSVPLTRSPGGGK